MVDVSTTVPTLMAALTVPVILDIHWTTIQLTAQVILYIYTSGNSACKGIEMGGGGGRGALVPLNSNWGGGHGPPPTLAIG